MPRTPPSPDILKDYIPDLESVEECFAQGGFKWVYKAVVQGSTEALKVVEIRKIEDSDDDIADAFVKEQSGRIRREIDVLRMCETTSIVKLGGILPTDFETADIHYLAYSEEFLEGDDLWKQILNQTAERPELDELNDLFVSLLKCIEELWRHGYVHRDIKPQNVMKTGVASRPFVLLDLGIAFSVHDTNLTFRPNERMPVATYRYIAPEMMQPDFRDRIDYRTDLYAAGMTIFEYAAARHPLAGNADDLLSTISRALHSPPIPLSRFRPDLPTTFCKLVDGLLKKKPILRPANMKMLYRELEALK